MGLADDADPLEATIANRKSTAQQTLKVRKSKRLRRAQLAVISTNRLSGAFGSREGSRQTTPSGSRLTTPSGGSTRNSGASEGLSARNLLGKAAAAGDSVPLPPLRTIEARQLGQRGHACAVRRMYWTVLSSD